MLYNVLGGGLILGALFMATDYVTSPVSHTGHVIFGIGSGLITAFIRYLGALVVILAHLPSASFLGAFCALGTPKRWGWMGSIGEVSALLLILGGAWLIFRRIITWHIPVR